MEEARQCHSFREELNSLDKLNLQTEFQHKQVRQSERKPWKCHVCGHELRTRRNLINHMRTHTGERPFECKVSGCGQTFAQQSTLTSHIKFKHSDERPFKCDFLSCLYAYKSLSNLKKHKTMHSDERPFACSEFGCNYQAKRKDVLYAHSRNVHSVSKTFVCSKCNFKSNLARNLTRHMAFHEGCSERIQCSIERCDYTGMNNSALKWHMNRHSTPSPCPVSGCGRYAPTKEALKYHLELHNNPPDRVFKRPCPLRFKLYQNVDNQQSHWCVTTNEKPRTVRPTVQSDSSNNNWFITSSQILATTKQLNSPKSQSFMYDSRKAFALTVSSPFDLFQNHNVHRRT